MSLPIILIVDDQLDSLPVLRELKENNCEILSATSAEDAVIILRENVIDVLVTDLRMYDMSGLDLIAQAKVLQNSALQCIVITGHCELSGAIEAMRLGASDYLQKPLKPGQLQACVEKALARNKKLKKNRQKIMDERQRGDSIFDIVQAGLVLIDSKTHTIVDANPAACRMIGADRDEITNRVCHKFICPAEQAKCPITDLNQQINNMERSLLTSNGEEKPILKTVSQVSLYGKDLILESFMDISEQKRLRNDLYESHATFHAIVERSLDAIIIVDSQGITRFLNNAACELFGIPRREMTGRQFGFPIAPDESVEINIFHHQWGNRIAEMRVAETDWHGKHAYVASIRDISRRKKMEEEIRNLAIRDHLTNLPNRNFLEDCMVKALSMARRHHRKLAVLYLDLDNFKPVNDMYGHGVGDMVLQEVGLRLLHSVRGSDSVFRVGGDEFVILLNELESGDDALNVAEKVITALNAGFIIDDNSCHLGCSIGISIAPEHGEDHKVLIKNADIAMYWVKGRKKNGCVIFNAEMNAIS